MFLPPMRMIMYVARPFSKIWLCKTFSKYVLPGNQQNLSHEISTTVSKRYVNEGCLTHMEHILKMGFQGLLISDASDIYFLISPDLLGVSP